MTEIHDRRILSDPFQRISHLSFLFFRSFRPDFLLVRQNFRDASEDHKAGFHVPKCTVSMVISQGSVSRNYELIGNKARIHALKCTEQYLCSMVMGQISVSQN